MPSTALRALLPSTALVAGSAPHRAVVVRCTCGEIGCGSVSVRIRREGAVVIWDDIRSSLDKIQLDPMSFEAAAYDAELARADADRGWETRPEQLTRLVAARRNELDEADSFSWGLQIEDLFANPTGVTIVTATAPLQLGVARWILLVNIDATDADSAIQQFTRGPRSWRDVEFAPSTPEAIGRPPMARRHWRHVLE